MLAYVDENGNLSATPPDPKKAKVINADDIAVSVIKKEDIVEEVLRKGKVTYFNESKGYGFIKDLKTQESIFVHINALAGPLSENDKVTFETEQTKKGLTAVRVNKAQ
ncbi:cold-shock DNA-binding domain protein [Ostertagia ostertagi]